MAASMKMKNIKIAQIILCVTGFALSLYACHVEFSKEHAIGYKALCDISERMSCSNVLTSSYGRGFGIVDKLVKKDSVLNQSNSILGMAFFVLQFTLACQGTLTSGVVQTVTAVLANLGSVYLAFILYFVLKNICVVCISLYIVNAFILLSSIIKLNVLINGERQMKKRKVK